MLLSLDFDAKKHSFFCPPLITTSSTKIYSDSILLHIFFIDSLLEARHRLGKFFVHKDSHDKSSGYG